jgi:hypothetical protein
MNESMYGQQFAPQGFFGGLLGAPLGGLAGRGIGGLFGNPGLGSQIGQIAGGIGGSILPFSADPVAAAYAQQQALQQAQQQALQQQFAPQGFFGNLLGQVGQPLGGAIGGLFGNAGLGSQIGGIAGQLGRNVLPFSVDPITAAYAQQQLAQQQQQFAPQGFFGNLLGQVGQPLGGAIGGLFGNSGLGSQIGGIAGQLGRSVLPFNIDPMMAAYAHQQAQQQFAPQGFFGNLLGQVGQPLGGAIGGLFGNAGLGSQIGGIAGQIGRSVLPFSVDPITAAYVQQQLAQQQQQFAPQGFFGNLLGQVGQPLGGAIGGLFGNSGLGSQIGGIAGQLGRSVLPFSIDPVMAAYAQQQAIQQAMQQAQQAQQQGQQGGGYPGYQGGQQGAGAYGGQQTLH